MTPGTERQSFVAKVPDRPGELHRIAAVISAHGGNINRVQFDRRIDPTVLFFEVTTGAGQHTAIRTELAKAGYLLTSLRPRNTLRLRIRIPHKSGALLELLTHTNETGANIDYADFDDRRDHPDLLTMGLTLDGNQPVEDLLERLSCRYPLEVLEYDTAGKNLDDSVFYLRLAHEIREFVGDKEDTFLLSFLGDINHVAQELADRGKNPREVFSQIRKGGIRLRETSGKGFYADIQSFMLTPATRLICCQPPCGGNVYLFDSPSGQVMVDTGYGLYHDAIRLLFQSLCPGGLSNLARIIITHGDADHCGGGGYYPVSALLHPGTGSIIRTANRAYGSRSENSILEEVYTTMINLFSGFRPPHSMEILPPAREQDRRGIFPVLARITIGDIPFEVLEGLGGHQHGQIYLFSPEQGVLFTADTAINYPYISPERTDYNNIAVFLVTSVNVDSGIAREERKALHSLAMEYDKARLPGSRPCLLCCGHGPVSVLDKEGMVPFGDTIRYTPPS